MRISILVALGLAVAACGGDGNGDTDHDNGHDRDAEPSHPEMRAATDADEVAVVEGRMAVEGVVAVVGADPSPQVVLTLGEGAIGTQVAVVGDLREEIGRLSGVEIAVEGDSVANPYGGTSPAIDVQDYDVVSVNATPAYLGILEHRDGELWLERDHPYRLTTVPERFGNLAGAKVWIVGPIDGDELQVLSYGIVREH